MRAIKAIVTLMTLLLVVGLGLLGYGLYSKSKHLSADRAPEPPESAAAPIGASSVALPQGARIVDMVAAGERVVLRVEGGEGGEHGRLLIVDPLRGAVVGTVTFTATQ